MMIETTELYIDTSLDFMMIETTELYIDISLDFLCVTFMQDYICMRNQKLCTHFSCIFPHLNLMKFSLQPQPVDLLNLMLDLLHMIYI